MECAKWFNAAMARTSYGEDKQSRAWKLLVALLQVQSDSQSDEITVNDVKITCRNWCNTEKPELEVQATLGALASLCSLTPEQVREALNDHLARLLGILEDRRSRKAGRGSENWVFMLRLWSIDLAENQREFDELWQLRKSGDRPTPPKKPDQIDKLVREVRSRSASKIKSKHGMMRMLRVNKPVPVDEIYIDLNVLEQVSRDCQFSDYCQDYQPGDRRGFHRLGLGQVQQTEVPALQKIQASERLMVLGKPGSGKSTLLKSLAVTCIEGKKKPETAWLEPYVPIFVSLKPFATDAQKQKQFNLLDYIYRQEFCSWGEKDSKIPESILDEGRALVLLDGLDEVPANVLDLVHDEIVSFCDRFYRNRFLISCRTQSRHRLEGFEDVEIDDFKPDQVERFIR